MPLKLINWVILRFLPVAILATAWSIQAVAGDGMVRRANVDFEAALAAYRHGEYSTAFDKWLPLAQDGDPAAMRNIGHLYHHGQGREQNFKQAQFWYKRAAETGLARAQANYADMLSRGQGSAPNMREAARWFLQAAARGHVISQYRIGLAFLRGQGVVRNPRAARYWLLLAHKAGYAPAKIVFPQSADKTKAAKSKIIPARKPGQIKRK